MHCASARWRRASNKPGWRSMAGQRGDAPFPEPPYYAVIFTSLRSGEDEQGYQAMAARMMELAQARPGYLGMESARGGDGMGITVSCWSDLEAIAAWKRDAEHLEAQGQGRRLWYHRYRVRIARVERAYDFGSGDFEIGDFERDHETETTPE